MDFIYVVIHKYSSNHNRFKVLAVKQYGNLHNCSFCSYSARDFISLKDHLCAHSEIYSQRCYICNQHFSEEIYLMKHLQCHSDPNDTSCFLCVVCLTKFKSINSLLLHCQFAKHS